MANANVVDNPAGSRFDLFVDDKPAGLLAYLRRATILELVHTEVDPAFGGHGYGTVLARGALDAARVEGLQVIPLCPFVQSFLRKNPDYLDLVSPEERARFKLDR